MLKISGSQTLSNLADVAEPAIELKPQVQTAPVLQTRDELAPLKPNSFEEVLAGATKTDLLQSLEAQQIAGGELSENQDSVTSFVKGLSPETFKQLGELVREGLGAAGLPLNLADHLFGPAVAGSIPGNAAETASEGEPFGGFFGTGFDAPGFTSGTSPLDFSNASEFRASLSGVDNSEHIYADNGVVVGYDPTTGRLGVTGGGQLHDGRLSVTDNQGNAVNISKLPDGTIQVTGPAMKVTRTADGGRVTIVNTTQPATSGTTDAAKKPDQQQGSGSGSGAGSVIDAIGDAIKSVWDAIFGSDEPSTEPINEKEMPVPDDYGIRSGGTDGAYYLPQHGLAANGLVDPASEDSHVEFDVARFATRLVAWLGSKVNPAVDGGGIAPPPDYQPSAPKTPGSADPTENPVTTAKPPMPKTGPVGG